MISHLCKISGVSRSEYYNYYSPKSLSRRQQRDYQDGAVKDIILKAYNLKAEKKELAK
jgi:hypothetical protein